MIVPDLVNLIEEQERRVLREPEAADRPEEAQLMQCLRKAHKFVAGLVADDRGMVYMIG